jgi:hypothetical protein
MADRELQEWWMPSDRLLMEWYSGQPENIPQWSLLRNADL